MTEGHLKRKNLLVITLVFAVVFCGGIAVMGDIAAMGLVTAPFLLWAWVTLSRRNCAVACMILVIFSEGLYRINSFGVGDRRIGDVAFILLAVGIAANWRPIWQRTNRHMTSYMVAILLLSVTVVISIYFGSHLVFNQPFLYGLIPARKFFLITVYFFLLGVRADQHDLQLFFKYLAWWGGVLAILGIIDSMLGGGVVFREYHQIGNVRAGSTRLAIGTFNVCFSIIYASNYLLRRAPWRKGWSFYLALLLICLFNLFFVSMTRAAIIGITLTALVMLFRSGTRTQIMGLVGLGIIIPIAWLSYPLVSNTESVIHIGELTSSISTDINRDEGNVAIRKKSAEALYKVYRERSPLVGVGLFSDDRFPNNPIAILSHYHNLNMTDVNGLATLIRFGLPGLCLLGFFLYKTFKDSNKLMATRHTGNKFMSQVIFGLLLYIFFTPTLGNIIVERMLIYTGIICYTIDLYSQRLRIES